jgi:hypothetical protein
MAKTLGQLRVRQEYNEDIDVELINKVKVKSAELIDLINGINSKTSEKHRLKSLAMTSIEKGCMWTVKAITLTE